MNGAFILNVILFFGEISNAITALH